MINALRISRLFLAVLTVWQLITLLDIFIGILINFNMPVSNYLLITILGKVFAACLFGFLIYKARNYINALALQKNQKILKNWYSI